MKQSRLLLSAAVALGLSISAHAADKNEKYAGYSQAEIYQAMCQRCHGKYAEGNPKKKGPALTGKTEAELAVEIYELEGGGYQSSGSPHDIMEYNMEVIKNKGMNVNADKMAKYIYENFGKK
jgi:cytochrome c553